MDEVAENDVSSIRPETNDPPWLEPIKNAYANCFDTSFEARKIFEDKPDQYAGSVAVEYDLKIRNETFQLIDQLKDRLPVYMPLGSKEADFSKSIGTPNPILFRSTKYFATNTHEWYVVSRIGQEVINPRFDPGSSDFLGIEAVKNIQPKPVGVIIYPPQEKYLRTKDTQEETEELISALSSYLSDRDKEDYLKPLSQRIASLEARKKLVIAEGLGEYGRISKQKVMALVAVIPERYKKQIKEPIEVGFEYKEDPQDDSPSRTLFFLPDQGELVFVSNVVNRDGNYLRQPDMRTAFLATDRDWFMYATRVAGKLIDLLPVKYSQDKYLWALKNQKR